MPDEIEDKKRIKYSVEKLTSLREVVSAKFWPVAFESRFVDDAGHWNPHMWFDSIRNRYRPRAASAPRRNPYGPRGYSHRSSERNSNPSNHRIVFVDEKHLQQQIMKANLSQTEVNKAGEVKLGDKVVREEPSFGRQILNILRMAKPPPEKHVRIEEPQNKTNVLERFTNELLSSELRKVVMKERAPKSSANASATDINKENMPNIRTVSEIEAGYDNIKPNSMSKINNEERDNSAFYKLLGSLRLQVAALDKQPLGNNVANNHRRNYAYAAAANRSNLPANKRMIQSQSVGNVNSSRGGNAPMGNNNLGGKSGGDKQQYNNGSYRNVKHESNSRGLASNFMPQQGHKSLSNSDNRRFFSGSQMLGPIAAQTMAAGNGYNQGVANSNTNAVTATNRFAQMPMNDMQANTQQPAPIPNAPFTNAPPGIANPFSSFNPNDGRFNVNANMMRTQINSLPQQPAFPPQPVVEPNVSSNNGAKPFVSATMSGGTTYYHYSNEPSTNVNQQGVPVVPDNTLSSNPIQWQRQFVTMFALAKMYAQCGGGYYQHQLENNSQSNQQVQMNPMAYYQQYVVNNQPSVPVQPRYTSSVALNSGGPQRNSENQLPGISNTMVARYVEHKDNLANYLLRPSQFFENRASDSPIAAAPQRA